MGTRNLTEKQTQKLRDAGVARKNGKSINPRYSHVVNFDKNGNLKIDMRTKEGKEINQLLNSRNRPSSSRQVSYNEKAYRTLERRLAKDFPDKTASERERLSDRIIRKVEIT